MLGNKTFFVIAVALACLPACSGKSVQPVLANNPTTVTSFAGQIAGSDGTPAGIAAQAQEEQEFEIIEGGQRHAGF